MKAAVAVVVAENSKCNKREKSTIDIEKVSQLLPKRRIPEGARNLNNSLLL